MMILQTSRFAPCESSTKPLLDIITEHRLWSEPALRQFAREHLVRLVSSGALVLLNYEDDIRNEDWTDFSRQCRGVVLDLAARRIVAHPFDKFFNLDAHPESRFERLLQFEPIEAALKYDGSMVTVFRHAGQIHVTTRSAFENPQIAKAHELLRRRHLELEGSLLRDRTLVFELVSPQLPNVVSYAHDQLILTGVRDPGGEMWPYSAVRGLAQEHGLGAPEIEHGTLQAFVQRAKEEDLPELAEGWVLRLANGQFVKVKRWQYLAQLQIQKLGLSNAQLTARYCGATAAQWDAFLANLPPLARAAVGAFGRQIQGQIDRVAASATQRMEVFREIASAREFAEAVRRDLPPAWQWLIFALRSGKAIEPLIRKRFEELVLVSDDSQPVTPRMLREWALTMQD